MLQLDSLHHVAIICSDYPRSKQFYTEVLGFEVIQEVYREARDSYKLDLSLRGQHLVELFSFPDPPQRPTRPEARGLRHLAFTVTDIEREVQRLRERGIGVEGIRTDEYTEQRYTFFQDPDGLPIELYEAPTRP